MEMYKIFAIGNSLTSDTTRFFTEICEKDQGYSKSVAALIGGMNLEGHAQRSLSGAHEYEIYINGINSRFKTSLGEALASDEWDYIIMQQAYDAFENPENLSKYYKYFADCFKLAAPKAKVLILNTWAPFVDGDMKKNAEQNRQYEEMALCAAQAMNLDKSSIVPVGKVIDKTVKGKIPYIYRDNVHLTLSGGRYAAALTLYSYLSGKKAVGNDFRTFLNPRTEEDFLFGELCGDVFTPMTEENIRKIQENIDSVLHN